jgi:hypothetical protein
LRSDLRIAVIRDWQTGDYELPASSRQSGAPFESGTTSLFATRINWFRNVISDIAAFRVRRDLVASSFSLCAPHLVERDFVLSV